MRNFFAAIAALCLLTATGAAHAARFWVSNELGDVAPNDVATVAEPKPVQLIFQFQTSGAANARATNALKDQITELVTTSGIFSQVSADPTANGAIISVTINNVPQADAASRGFATGLTFGLAGTTVADYYEASSEYVAGPEASIIRKEARHTLITTLGISDEPENTTRARNAEEGIRTIVRQLMTHMLNDVARDSAFAVAPQTPEAPAEVSALRDAPALTPAETLPTDAITDAPAAPVSVAAP